MPKRTALILNAIFLIDIHTNLCRTNQTFVCSFLCLCSQELTMQKLLSLVLRYLNHTSPTFAMLQCRNIQQSKTFCIVHIAITFD